MMSLLGDAKKGMRPGGTWPAMADTRAAVRAISVPIMGERH